MPEREPCAPHFYSGDCRVQMDRFGRGFSAKSLDIPKHIVAGIVPHAGWFYSGATAAKVFLSIRESRSPGTFIMFGAVHVPGVHANSVYADGGWETPLGPVQVDSALAKRLLGELGSLLAVNPGAHRYEHSIEVQTPMIKYLFPDSKILPIAVPPAEDAVRLGEGIGRLVHDWAADAVVIGSTDLTHYGMGYGFAPAGYGRDAHDWVINNDQRIIAQALSLNAHGVLTEAVSHQNACGAGAMAAAVAAAKAMGASRGCLVEHTTSYDVHPEGEFEMAVGYAGIVF